MRQFSNIVAGQKARTAVQTRAVAPPAEVRNLPRDVLCNRRAPVEAFHQDRPCTRVRQTERCSASRQTKRPHRAAEQHVNRLPSNFPRMSSTPAASPISRSHPPARTTAGLSSDEMLDPRGVFADQYRLEILHRAHHTTRLPTRSSRRVAIQTSVICVDVNKKPVCAFGTADHSFERTESSSRDIGQRSAEHTKVHPPVIKLKSSSR